MREQPPKNGLARRLWDMSDEEIDEVFASDDRDDARGERQTTIESFGGIRE